MKGLLIRIILLSLIFVGGCNLPTYRRGPSSLDCTVPDEGPYAWTECIDSQDMDSDGDRILDRSDCDDDNDGIADRSELYIDSDGDGVCNPIDLDSDSDNINDIIEGFATSRQGNADGDAREIDALDADGDGRVDSSVDSDRNGLAASADPRYGKLAELPDTDGDSKIDVLDDDSDGDNVLDKDEGRGYFRLPDRDGDGICDGGIAVTYDGGSTYLCCSSGQALASGQCDAGSSAPAVGEAAGEASGDAAVAPISDASGTITGMDYEFTGPVYFCTKDSSGKDYLRPVPLESYACSVDGKTIESCGVAGSSTKHSDCGAGMHCVGDFSGESPEALTCVKDEDLCIVPQGDREFFLKAGTAMCDLTDGDRERFFKCIRDATGATMIVRDGAGALPSCADMDTLGKETPPQKCDPYKISDFPCEVVCHSGAANIDTNSDVSFSDLDLGSQPFYPGETRCSSDKGRAYMCLAGGERFGVPGEGQTRIWYYDYNGNCRSYGMECSFGYDYKLGREVARCDCPSAPASIKAAIDRLNSDSDEANDYHAQSSFGKESNCPYWCDATPDLPDDDKHVLYNRISCDPSDEKRMVICGAEGVKLYAAAPGSKVCAGGPGFLDGSDPVNMPFWSCPGMPPEVNPLVDEYFRLNGRLPVWDCPYWCEYDRPEGGKGHMLATGKACTLKDGFYYETVCQLGGNLYDLRKCPQGCNEGKCA